MKNSILFVFILALSLFLQPSQATILTYIVEREIDQEDQYVELTLKVQADGRSLAENIQSAASVIERIKNVVTSDCEMAAPKKSQAKKCKELIEVSNYEVEPKYHMVRKIPTFTRIILTIQSSSSPTSSPYSSKTSKQSANSSTKSIERGRA